MRVTLLDAGEHDTQVAGAPVVVTSTPTRPTGWIVAGILVLLAALILCSSGLPQEGLTGDHP
jgi:hypothetical protein